MLARSSSSHYFSSGFYLFNFSPFSFFAGLRRWVQAVFRISNGCNSSSSKDVVPGANCLRNDIVEQEVEGNSLNGLVNDSAVDLSEGVAFDMFGISPSSENEVGRSALLCFFLVLKGNYQSLSMLNYILMYPVRGGIYFYISIDRLRSPI